MSRELPYCLVPSLASHLVARQFDCEAERLEASLIDAEMAGYLIEAVLADHRDKFAAECALLMPSMAYH